MPATIFETHLSRAYQFAEQDSHDLLFTIVGAADETEARALIDVTIPGEHDGHLLQSVDLDPEPGGLWSVTAHYSTKEPKETNDSVFSFDTSGGNQKITQSLATIGMFVKKGDPVADFQGAIGVTSSGDGGTVEGVDVTVPVFAFNETHYRPAREVTPSLIQAIFRTTGTINGAPFRGFAPGEVLFLGASGSKRGKEDWELSFRFAASPNADNLFVGEIGPITKAGWDYLWVRYQDVEGDNSIVKRPVQVNVERVYPLGDFSALGIGVA